MCSVCLWSAPSWLQVTEKINSNLLQQKLEFIISCNWGVYFRQNHLQCLKLYIYYYVYYMFIMFMFIICILCLLYIYICTHIRVCVCMFPFQSFSSAYFDQLALFLLTKSSLHLSGKKTTITQTHMLTPHDTRAAEI